MLSLRYPWETITHNL